MNLASTQAHAHGLGQGLVHLSRASARVALRRARRGPRRPGWSFAYEALAEATRQLFLGATSLEAQRAEMDVFGELERLRRRCHFETLEVAGVPALRATPRTGAGATVFLYLHGGGYCIGSPTSHIAMVAGLAEQCHATVLAIDYRLAPEHPCPAAIEDAVAAYGWLVRDQDVAPGRIVVAGDSAGGGLTLTTLVALRDGGLPRPACAVLLSPWGDLRENADEFRRPAPDDFLAAEPTDGMAAAYAGALPDDDPRVSPIFADLHRLPPLLILAGEAEFLLPDSERLADRARAAGVNVTLDVEPDEIHVYPVFHDMNPRGRAALLRIADFVRAHADA